MILSEATKRSKYHQENLEILLYKCFINEVIDRLKDATPPRRELDAYT